MGRGIKKNLIFIIILAIGAAISGLIIVTTACSVDMLDYIEEKIALDEAKDDAGEIDVFSGILYRDMVSVSGGSYIQSGSQTFAHNVSSFSIGRYEVTYELWYMVHNWAIANGYTFANSGKEGHDGTAGAAPTGAKYEPVTVINWRDTIVWCNAYSEMSGSTPIYFTDAGYTLPLKTSTNSTFVDTIAGSEDNPYVNWSANGYRLPTEGEWQYAASNKGTIPWEFASGATAAYDDAIETKKVAWYNANSEGRTHNVGTTDNSSALTLWDMSGNVFELCWDWYDDNYPVVTMTDYTGPDSGSERVIRGGGWNFPAGDARLGFRGHFAAHRESEDVGFRMASKQ